MARRLHGPVFLTTFKIRKQVEHFEYRETQTQRFKNTLKGLTLTVLAYK